MFRSRIRRVLGQAAIFAWSELIIAAAISLASSCPPPVPRARVTTPITREPRPVPLPVRANKDVDVRR